MYRPSSPLRAELSAMYGPSCPLRAELSTGRVVRESMGRFLRISVKKINWPVVGALTGQLTGWGKVQNELIYLDRANLARSG